MPAPVLRHQRQPGQRPDQPFHAQHDNLYDPYERASTGVFEHLMQAVTAEAVARGQADLDVVIV
ncbi:hypothetical protein [Nonomuraea recticatena]|uniref:Uncharacterized protein n=1 Tax=Nonomuraea recticatena TaxID=46178 RepID=A0ABN3TAA0_9ACTN